MKSIKVNGGKKLNGTIRIDGSKNSSLPIICLALVPDKAVINNVPNNEDVLKMIKIVSSLGSKVEYKDNTLYVDNENLKTGDVKNELAKEIRGSYYLMGALINKFNEVKIASPGGCIIGKRPINFHVDAFQKIGIEVIENENDIILKKGKFKKVQINFEKPSVGATINVLFSLIKNDFETILTNISIEPEVIEVIEVLKKIGVKIELINRTLKIKGTKIVKDFKHTINSDRIETGTYLALGSLLGNIKIERPNIIDNILVIDKIMEYGAEINIGSTITIKENEFKHIKIITEEYPGFPTDLQQIFSVLMLKGNGTIVENIFSNRFNSHLELQKFGANIEVINNLALINKSELRPAEVNCTDLRGGMSLVMAALLIEGESVINKVELIERGYPDFVNKLKKIGADIEYIN